MKRMMQIREAHRWLVPAFLVAAAGAAAMAQVGSDKGTYSTKPPFPGGGIVSSVGKYHGKPVTVSAKGITLHEALGQLREQAGVQFSLTARDLEQKSVTLEAKDQPLFETLVALFKQVDPAPGWSVRDPGANSGLGYLGGPMSPHGAFLLSIQRISHQVSTVPDKPERYQLTTAVLADSTVMLSGVKTESTATKAEDEHGNSMVWTGNLARTLTPLDLHSALRGAQVTIVLQPLATGDLPKKIALLEGSMPATFVTTEPLEAALGEKATKTFGGYTVTLELTAKKGNANAGTATLKYVPDESVSDADWADWQAQLLGTNMRLFDAEGKSLSWDNAGFGSSGKPRSYWATLSYPPQAGPARPGESAPVIGTPTKVVVDAPVNFRVVHIPYRFENVVLP